MKSARNIEKVFLADCFYMKKSLELLSIENIAKKRSLYKIKIFCQEKILDSRAWIGYYSEGDLRWRSL